MKLSFGGEAGSSISMAFNVDGSPRIVSRGGSAKAVITGRVNDKDENRLGDLHNFELEAVESLGDRLPTLE